VTSVAKIKIGGHMTGLIGLNEVLEEIVGQDNEIKEGDMGRLLVEKLAVRNYIPSDVTDIYETALLREYKKYIGELVEEEPLEEVQVKVLGAGCPRCDYLEQEMMAVIAQTNVKADLEHVRDIKEISRYGVMGSPALVINGEVKFVGPVPSRTKLKHWIEQAENSINS